ncbi:MAG: hypothetical protein JWQ95_6591 [Sphaerisporangium sp.]|nr:hypothetical protein [Sphaerisporangium sp.]
MASAEKLLGALPAPKTYVPAAELAGLTMETATEVGYLAQRDQAKPADPQLFQLTDLRQEYPRSA